ncbi:MAG: hypothetical protein IV093_11460 [Rubrivivax sp.]|nr:hypothetical protein [Rubrivivax sp.]
MKTQLQSMKWAVVALAAALAACGGGGGDDDAGTPPTGGGTPTPPVGSATGVLTDAAVQGVAFSTSSGVTGTTDALGQYRYNPGDTVSFALGALTLGAVPATAVVTPIELAGGSNDKLQNLLVLLQSLDADGVADNGINIPAAAAAAVTTGVDLASAPATFASAANTGLAAAQTAGGISRAITSSEAASAHFLSQAPALLSSQVWVDSSGTGTSAGFAFLRIGPAGEVLMGQAGPTAGGGFSGVELGSVLATSVDARGFALVPTLSVDTNGEWGLSSQDACDRVRITGGQLVFDDAPASCVSDEIATATKAPNDNTTLVGVWAGGANIVNTQHFVFWADGRYAMIDPIGDTENNCGGPGVEFGTYSYNAATGAFRLLSVTVDSNGCAGLSDLGNANLASAQVTLSADGKTASFLFAGEPEVFPAYRISR